ncbi:MAG: 2-hydroxyacyl-CoA dehydratase family protein [Acidimicrobiia bacterium]
METQQVAIRPALSHAGDTRTASRVLMDAWWSQLGDADATAQPVANTFVMGSLAEILNTFDIPMSFPEIAALQTAVKGKAMDYLLAAEDLGYSPDICGYVKVDIGLHATGRNHPLGKYPKPAMVVASNMCNTYIKWAEIWERQYGCPVFVLDLPGWRGTDFEYDSSSETFRNDVKYVEGQIRDLIILAEEVSGKKFDIDKLREILGNVNRMSELYRSILALNKNKPAPFNALTEGINYMGIANILRGRPEGVEFMETVLTELEERVVHGVGAVPDERFRLLLVGTACYTNFREFVGMFERWDGIFVASEYMSYAGGGLDRGLNYDLSRPVESLAEQILITAQPSMSGIFFSHEWQAKVAEEYDIDGICYHGVKSCRTTAAGLPDAREWLLSNADVPGLFIQSDLVDSRLWAAAQMRNRIDAFFESLQSRRIQAGV